MRILYTLLSATLVLPAAAQPSLPSFFPADTVSMPCPQNPTASIRTYAGWEAYQTLDDTWYGPRDTAICIDLAHVSGNWVYPRIAIDQIVASRPVFVRARYDDDHVLPLATNNQYAFGFQVSTWTSFDAGPCPSGPCTGLLAGVRIPDSAGTGTDMRWHQAAYDDQDLSQYQLEVCVPTEKFQQNDLREFVVSLKVTDPQPGQYIDGFYSEAQDMDQWGTLVRLTSANLPQFQQGQFGYYFWSSWENYLVMHDNEEYPDGNHMFYLDMPANPNVPTPTTITAYLDPFTGFNFQPFTQLRGGLVLGSDSVRHPLTVVNLGADLCMGWEFIEVLWPGGAEYVHQSGHVSFEGRNACFQFQPGSTLRVAEGSTFQYGHNGRGLLLMIEGAHLEIGRDAELLFEGSMILKEPPEATEPRDMRITLADGARLTFAPGSRLLNDWSIGGRMRLIVTLDGGSIDINGLSPEDRAKVQVIELPREAWSELRMMGNPARDQLTVAFGTRSPGLLQVRVIDSEGRLAMERRVHVEPGENTLVLPTFNLGAGAYLLETSMGDERRYERFVKE